MTSENTETITIQKSTKNRIENAYPEVTYKEAVNSLLYETVLKLSDDDISIKSKRINETTIRINSNNKTTLQMLCKKYKLTYDKLLNKLLDFKQD